MTKNASRCHLRLGFPRLRRRNSITCITYSCRQFASVSSDIASLWDRCLLQSRIDDADERHDEQVPVLKVELCSCNAVIFY